MEEQACTIITKDYRRENQRNKLESKLSFVWMSGLTAVDFVDC